MTKSIFRDVIYRLEGYTDSPDYEILSLMKAGDIYTVQFKISQKHYNEMKIQEAKEEVKENAGN